MVDDNPNDITSTTGQSLWRQRIAKESALSSPRRREDFSLRSALKTQDVPLRFKPGQINVHDQAGHVKGLDSATERSLRADIAAKLQTPSEQLLWPETEQHQVGWLAKPDAPGLPLLERHTLAGLSPRVGFGWLNKEPQMSRPTTNRATSNLRAQERSSVKAQGSDEVTNPHLQRSEKELLVRKWLGMTKREKAPVVQEVEAAPSPSPRLGRKEQRLQAVAEEQQRINRLQQEWEVKKQQKKEMRRQRYQAGHSEVQEVPALTATPRQVQLEPFSKPAASAGLRHAVKIPVDDAWLGAAVVPRPGSKEERGVAQANNKSRKFLNGPENAWFKPKGSSDVVAFGDAYARSWGVSLFSKTAMPGGSST
eukprot:TRINITY_DN39433_c0_g1_i1.p1 TRINITY_DN39433_c0_g1~~TRINITY_DN39433_c0_g1_i1.p1  ORF type:complete len:366 (+),score=75.30 TRINITY_DN39433_c0_g1_i1:76-1173(+)